jgi:lipopolysaccharide transport system ATP-binding protein
MEEITQQQGRTVLFVSHNLNSIKELCKKTILIENGRIKAFDTTDKILDIYNENNNKIIESKSPIEFESTNKNKDFIFKKIWITIEDGSTTNMILHNQGFYVNVEMEIFKENWPLEISLTIKNSNGINVTSTSLSDSKAGKMYAFKKGLYKTAIKIKGDFLIPDTYTVRLYAHEKGVQDIDIKDEAIRFKIIDAGSTMHSYGEASTYWSCVFSNANWEIQELK